MSVQQIPMLFWDGDDMLFLTSATRRIRFVKATVSGATMTGTGEGEKGTTAFQFFVASDGWIEEGWQATPAPEAEEQKKEDDPGVDGVVVKGPWGDGSAGEG